MIRSLRGLGPSTQPGAVHRVLAVAARITRSARTTTTVALDRTWRWAKDIAAAYTRPRDAFA